MRDGAFDPLQLAPEFWDRPDVRAAWLLIEPH